MWVVLICGLVIFWLLKRYFYDGDLFHASDTLSSHADVLFSISARLLNLSGGRMFVGLRIPDPDPDPDSASRRNIDIVLVTHSSEPVVISVQNVCGLVSIDASSKDWVCTPTTAANGQHKSSKQLRLPDPVAEAKQQVSILESYLEQRGLPLPEGYLSYKIICPNPNFRTLPQNTFPSEIITYDQWIQLKPESTGAFGVGGGKKEMQESLHEKLNFILSTAPKWDRFVLKGGKFLFGEFLEFKGKHDDLQALRNVGRSKVDCLIIQKTSMFGLAHPKLQVLYSHHNYSSEGASASACNEVTVGSNTEVVFQSQDFSKVLKYKLSSLALISLCA